MVNLLEANFVTEKVFVQVTGKFETATSLALERLPVFFATVRGDVEQRLAASMGRAFMNLVDRNVRKKRRFR